MKQHKFSRTELLIGTESQQIIGTKKVLVLGIGGVGSYTIESLVRGGIQHIVIVDDDTVCLTNINRQIQATSKTLGHNKVDAMRDRILEINPQCEVIVHNVFITKENMADIITDDIDYVVDAIDTVTSKLDVIQYCKEQGIEVISCLGTGNKFDPTMFRITDISKTKVCPLAKVMRSELKKRRIKNVKVLYSEEMPTKPKTNDIVNCKNGCVCIGGSSKCTIRRQIPGSNSFVPPVAGMIIAGEVLKTLWAVPVEE